MNGAICPITAQAATIDPGLYLTAAQILIGVCLIVVIYAGSITLHIARSKRTGKAERERLFILTGMIVAVGPVLCFAVGACEMLAGLVAMKAIA